MFISFRVFTHRRRDLRDPVDDIEGTLKVHLRLFFKFILRQECKIAPEIVHVTKITFRRALLIKKRITAIFCSIG